MVRSRYRGAFVHSIAWVKHERGTTTVSNRQGRLSMTRRLLPNLIVSNALVPIVKGIFEPCNGFPRYPII
jgi:hypothetical protein